MCIFTFRNFGKKYWRKTEMKFGGVGKNTYLCIRNSHDYSLQTKKAYEYYLEYKTK